MTTSEATEIIFSPVDKSIGPKNKESKERLDANLKLALLYPKDANNLISQVIGIPVEVTQLKNVQIQINGTSSNLLQIMEETNLIGEAKGVPHLSVGGSTRSHIAEIDKVEGGELQESNASRSYLANESLGVQGMGLVQYEGREQIGFGLGMPFLRPNKSYDTGGGVHEHIAKDEIREANEFWLQSKLFFGNSKFARLYNYYPYTHGIYKASSIVDNSDKTRGQNDKVEYLQNCAVIIREDGRREVSKEAFTKAIWEQIPFFANIGRISNASFSNDGHNAFMKDGKVVFTDYEAIMRFNEHPVDFMYKLHDQFNSWWFEDLRKNYPEFCRIMNLRPLKGKEVDYEGIRSRLTKDLETYTDMDKEFKVKEIRKFVNDNDNRGLMRCAMAAVINSRSMAVRTAGMPLLGELVKEMLYKDLTKTWTLEEMNRVIVKKVGNQVVTKKEYFGDKEYECLLYVNEQGELRLVLPIDNYGLPIENQSDIPVTPNEIYRAWKVGPEDLRLNLDLSNELAGNPVEGVPKNFLNNTIYSQLASGLTLLYHHELNPIGTENVIEENMSIFVEEGETTLYIDPPADFNYQAEIKIKCGDDVEVKYDNEINQFVILSNGKLRAKNISDLNKFAYAIHALTVYVNKIGLSGNIEIQLDL